jgi:hypothetical protein
MNNATTQEHNIFILFCKIILQNKFIAKGRGKRNVDGLRGHAHT